MFPGEDLSVFFNPGEFAVAATLKTPEGTPLRTINVILSLPVGELAVGAGEVAHLQPTFQCPTADLEGVRKDYIAEIGADTFRVVRRESDGTGVSTVWLRKQ